MRWKMCVSKEQTWEYNHVCWWEGCLGFFADTDEMQNRRNLVSLRCHLMH